MKPLIALTCLLAVVALGAACGDDEEEGSGGTATPAASVTEEPSPCPTTPAISATPAPSPEPTAAFEGGTDPVEEEGPAVPPVAIMYDLRYGCHDTFDRIVFDFRDNIPGYRVEYVEPPISQDGSGEPLDIDGNAFLYVRFYVAQAHDEAGQSTYTGPRQITPGLEAVSEIEMAGDFEGYVSWGIGLPEELDFRVTDLADPYRVVIDIEHP
jgi:hypothetical protein